MPDATAHPAGELDLPDLGAPAAPTAPDLAALDRLSEVGVELSVQVGRTRMTLGDALALVPGSVVALDSLADRPVDVLVNGRRVAAGEVVVVDERYGVRITDVLGRAAVEPA